MRMLVSSKNNLYLYIYIYIYIITFICLMACSKFKPTIVKNWKCTIVWLTLRIMLCNVPYERRYNQLANTPMSCSYAWLHTWWLVTSMLIMPLGLMYVFKLLYAIKCFRVMACLGFQLCWRLYKRPSSSLLLLVFLKFLCQGEFLP